VVVNEAAYIVSVEVVEFDRIRGINTSFHAVINENINVAARPGRTIGRIIRKINWVREHPSISAESKRALGISLKNPLSIHVVMGAKNKTNTRIIPVKLPARPTFETNIYSGIIRTIAGAI
jgi:hypothetical protein